MDHYITLDLEDFNTRDDLQYILNKYVGSGYRIANIIQGFASGQFPERQIAYPIIILEKQPTPVPEGLENIRELDAELAEMIEAGLIEKRDCDYAVIQQ